MSVKKPQQKHKPEHEPDHGQGQVQITLASASPRRAELLRQIQVSFQVCPVNIDESHRPGETALEFVQRLALEKAHEGYIRQPLRPCLGSDTIVVIDEMILGKPADQAAALEMLSRLSGRRHQVMTAVAVCSEGFEQRCVNISQVEFAEISSRQILDYWHTGEPTDKAGAYAIQGLAAQFIKHIQGSYSGIMGLPLYETAQLLKQVGVSGLWAPLNEVTGA